MDLNLTATVEAVRDAEVVVPLGGGTHGEVGGDVATGDEVRAPAGVVRHDPADLTVTVGGGTTVGDLDAALAEHGQECPLDPRSEAATVGGVLAVGLSGTRRLGLGPLRDRVLQVRVVLADGRVVKGGGPTVKNVSGYDLPRLFTGSLGTLGVIAEATLRCQPRAGGGSWFTSPADPQELRRALFRPTSLLWDGATTWCRLDGHGDDVTAQAAAAGLAAAPGGPALPAGDYRGRVAVAPGRLSRLGDALATVAGAEWLAEVGVGTVHVSAPDGAVLGAVRALAESEGGWMLREAGAGVDGFGSSLPNLALIRRIKAALDPLGKMSPGRLPL